MQTPRLNALSAKQQSSPGLTGALYLGLALLLGAVLPAAAQTPNSLRVGYINTFAGSPVGYTSTAGVVEPICQQSISTVYRQGVTSGGTFNPGGMGDGCSPTQALLGGPT